MSKFVVYWYSAFIVLFDFVGLAMLLWGVRYK